MIFGTGIDVVDCTRMNRPLMHTRERFLGRLLTPLEIHNMEKKVSARAVFANEETLHKYLCMQVAKSFAAKEAFVKALGTGFRGGITLKDVEVMRNTMGKPVFLLSSKVQSILKNSIPPGMEDYLHLSLCDEYPYAHAQVTIEFY
jgi:holo-[acyl-carrier protein] synthase